MGHRSGTIAPRFRQDGLNAVKFAAVGLTFQGVQHLLHQIVDIQQLQLGGAVVYLNGKIVGNIIAEGCYRAVIVGTAPLAEEIGKPIYQHWSSATAAVFEEQLLAGQLGLAVIGLTVAADEGGLNGACQHHGTLVSVVLQGIQQRGGKAEIALHKLFLILRPVDARQIEYEIRSLAETVQQTGIGVDIELHDLVNEDFAGAVLPFLNVAKIAYQVLTHESLGAGNQNFHFLSFSHALSASRTYSVVRILRTVPSTSRRTVLWLV